jgi:DNA-binding LacI/PurR family transcriptional regulator
MTTIQDVAKHAAVSVSTVSNVLNGRSDRMRPETLERVNAAIELLQFRPSRLAQQLKTGQTPLIGLLVPSMTNPMYGYMAREIETVAQERFGYRLLLGSTYRDPRKESAFLDDLLAQGVRRVIVISSLADERHFEAAAERGMVVVSYDRGPAPGRRSKVAHVMPDNFEVARMAAQHLIDHGHERLAFATVAGMTMGRQAKIDGFLAAVKAAGLEADAQVIDGGPLDEYGDAVIGEAGRTAALRIVGAAKRPTGIVALNDLMAFGLMAGLRESGLGVPGDVSVVGLDGHFLAALFNPMLTTVQLPVPELARVMVERVMHPQSDAQAGEAARVIPPTGLVVRESVARPAKVARKAGPARRPILPSQR